VKSDLRTGARATYTQLRLELDIINNPCINYEVPKLGAMGNIFVLECLPQKQQEIPELAIFNQVDGLVKNQSQCPIRERKLYTDKIV
jgi:hypothetical protein